MKKVAAKKKPRREASKSWKQHKLKAEGKAIATSVYGLYHPERGLGSARRYGERTARRISYMSRYSPVRLLEFGMSLANAVSVASSKAHRRKPISERIDIAKKGWGSAQVMVGGTHPLFRRIIIDTTESRFPIDRAEVLGHEVMHLHGTSFRNSFMPLRRRDQNHRVTAEAIGMYMGQMARPKPVLRGLGLPKDLRDPEFVGRTEQAYSGNGVVRLFKKSPYLPEHLGRYAPSLLGKTLGTLAAQIEREVGKPGVGAFFIREVSAGRKIGSVERDIRSGKFDKHAQRWVERTPGMLSLSKGRGERRHNSHGKRT
jgi:hypothetical protein